MKKVLKFIGAFVLVLALGLVVLYFVLDKPRPEGQAGPEAEQLTDKVLAWVGADAWQELGAVRWTYGGNHDYIWDKERNLVEVKWEDNRVLLDTKTQQGKAWVAGSLVSNAEQKAALIADAWTYFCNDSWWLNPVVKLRDPGTTRQLVELEEGYQGLMVTYESGGVTPGDSYLYWIGNSGQVMYYQMWVSILPIGGLKVSFDDWETTSNGAKVALSHYVGKLSFGTENFRAAMQLTDLTGGEDIFTPLFNQE